jgi:hypothetical protein
LAGIVSLIPNRPDFVRTMNKLTMLIAALHASALALGTLSGGGHAQDANEVRAYMNALAVGTPEALQAFLRAYPNSALPGSALGASIAASIDQPTASVGGTPGQDQAESAGASDAAADQGIY